MVKTLKLNLISWKLNYFSMSEKKNNFPKTKVKNPEPKIGDPDWIIWAAWADRITFEEIFEKTGKRESEVIKIMRRSLKPSAWIVTVAWLFFSIGPGVLVGNNIFGKPGNIETWSFGIPSLWVWQIISWALGVILIWFLAKNMEMSTSPDKKIISQTEDFGNTRS